jgi:hypothetical protein
MNCPRCAKPLVANATFCMHCGQVLAAPAGAASARPPASTANVGTGGVERRAVPAGAPPQVGSNRGLLIGAGVALAAVVLALLGLTAAGILRFGAGPPGEAPRATADQVQAPVAQTEPPASRDMPDDVRRWLLHLEQIEKRREQLSLEQSGRLAAVLGTLQASFLQDALSWASDGFIEPSQGQQQFAGEVENIRRSWKALADDFVAFPPPEECRPIAATYEPVLRETGAITADIFAAIQSGQDPQALVAKLNQVYVNHRQLIDQPAVRTDGMVADLCNKYNTHKWFSIQADYAGGLDALKSLGLPGLGGGGGMPGGMPPIPDGVLPPGR